MKKISSTIILSLFGFLILTASALADTTARFLPATLSTSAGQVFNVAIAIDPQGATNYAEKMEITYPADTLEVENFVPASNWLPLTQPGYDQLDNTNGILTKTAGYPGGFSTSTLFGIVTFEAKKTGTGVLTIDGNSMAFSLNNQTTITGNALAFSILPAPVTKPKTVVTVTVATTSQTISQPEEIPQTAAVANPTATTTETTGGASVWLWVLIIVIIVIVAIGIYTFTKQEQNK